MINSTSNKQIKNLIQLQTKAKVRREQQLYVVEGIRMYREIPKECLVKTYISESFYNKEENRAQIKAGETEVVADRVFAAVSDTKTPQGILCVAKQQKYSLDDMLRPEKPFLMMLEDIQDPGNLGTIFRTAEAAGVTGIIMSSGTVDIYNPKTIRSTMGSLYRMPFVITADFAKTIRKLQEKQVKIFAAYLTGSVDHTQADYTSDCAFLIGNEGNGLKKETAQMADTCVKISMEGQVESLNAAIAATVLMFEAKRQRR